MFAVVKQVNRAVCRLKKVVWLHARTAWVVSVNALLLAGATAFAQDWPQFLGPSRNGVYAGVPLNITWSKEGPPVVWKMTVGQGFSAPVVAKGKLILFHRVQNQEIVECLEAGSGRQIWTFAYPTHYQDDFGFDEGPRGTPSIAGGRVYTFGAEGVLHCLDFETGKKLWSVDTHPKFHVRKGFFGAACSPLVEGDRVILNIGGSDQAGIVAFDGNNGNVVWKATSDEAGYSSPVAATIGGARYLFCFTRAGLAVIEPSGGKVIGQFPWRSRNNASVNAAVPLVVGNQIFLSASYETGAVLLQWAGQNFMKVWASDEVLSNHYASSVFDKGYLFGFHGRQEYGPSLRSVELQTGKIGWSIEDFKAGTVTLAGDLLLIMKEGGELVIAPASAKEFRIVAQSKVLPPSVRAYPAIAEGLLYVRNEKILLCLDLKKK